MTRKRLLCAGAGLLLLIGCQSAGRPEAPSRADLSGELVRLDHAGPPAAEAGECWQSDVTPLVVETVSEQVMLAPETIAEDGTVVEPASFRSETHQRIVQEREEIWFRSPCPEEMTVDFVATLQRALKARGLYLLPLSGELDMPTRAAIRRFQADRGLESDRLSLAAARELGIVATDLDKL